MFRSDDGLLVNSHLFGAPASHSPVELISRVAGGRMFSSYMAGFDRVWAEASR